MKMYNILLLASAIVAVTNGIVQAIKQADVIPRRFLPIVAIVVGLLLGGTATFINASLVERLWAGMISGLAATGLFELGKNVNHRE